MFSGLTWSLFTLQRQSTFAARFLRRRLQLESGRQTRIDGVLNTRDENAKEVTRFLSSVNMVTCNPWYLWEKGFTKLWTQGRDGSRVEARGDYDEPRVRLMEYSSLPDGIRNRLDVADKLEWLCHPLSGYLMKVFLDAFELGRVWGSIVLERIIKPSTGYYYAHGYGLSSRVPDQRHIARVHDAAYRFWGPETTLAPEALARGSPPAIPKLQPCEEGSEGYLEAQAKCQEKLREYAAISDKFYEGIYIKEDFDLLLEKCHELFSRDLFSHISKHRDDESERRKYAVHFRSTGETFYDSPYAIKFDPQLIYKKLRRAEFSPQSKFVSRARKELSGYCAFLETEFSCQRATLEFDSYEDLLRSINIAESLESIPPVMSEVLGTVLDAVPEWNTARVYRAPCTGGVGMGNPLGTSRAVDALNGARTVFQTEMMRQKFLLRNQSGTTSRTAPLSLATKSSVMSQKPWLTWKERQAHPPVR